MAKQASVFYKLPIEEMRGKLATKQDGIMYAGQDTGQNTLSIGDGSHASTNFEKYIVLTKSRGKNRFYVKSRTTVTNTTGTINTRSVLALAMPLVDAIYARRDDATQMLGLKEAYEFYKRTGETLREYLTKVVVESIRRGKTNIEYLSKPNQQGLSEYVALITNPYKEADTNTPTIFVGGRNYGSAASEAKIIQEYLPYRALQMGGSKVTIRVHDTVSGSAYNMSIVVNNDMQFTDLIGTLQGEVYRVNESSDVVTTFTLFPFKLDYAVSAQPFLDAAKTQTLAATTVISTITDLYI